ncbi:MAG: magnesium transporter [Planctomycetaceae bacterium]|nr:magnesium transporter [Planctomycetales bacterium]MCB9874668.1 magnesium transporter [Planctomycetaceae bacterium]MCB9936866.1 magnesium transporter [Planctomycetaceae bacterium]
MINTLYLPELREMLAEHSEADLREFCTALHPARTAEFMEGLTPDEAWQVLKFADPRVREEIFTFFPHEEQLQLLQTQDRAEVAELIVELASDDRVDLLEEVPTEIVDQILPLLPAEVRREILRLRAYPEGSAGAVMTTEAAKLSESLTVREALDELSRQAEHLETIYYLYIVDDTDHLRGLVSARDLISAIGKPQTTLAELMETDLLSADVLEDQEEVARKVAHYDLLAIPVVDHEHRMLGIITHDDIIDVVREEATEDAHRIAAVEPLEASYLKTPILVLTWKRGIWLTILFGAAFLTAFALRRYEEGLSTWVWLAWFLPLIISTGGNTGNQAATLVITALSTGDVSLRDWVRVVVRELAMGLLLGGGLATFGYFAAWLSGLAPDATAALVIPITLLLIVIAGTLLGAMLPLLFAKIGLDPAMMSNPFVAGIIDILGIVVYMNVAFVVL